MEGVMSEMYYPTNDIVFKKIFADPKNKDLLKSLLSATLKIDIALMGDLVVENPEIKSEHIFEKSCSLDINLIVSGASVNIEMQVAKEEFFGDRELFYWSKLYTGKLEKGQDYGELRKSIVLAFVNHVMFENFENGYHSEYQVLEKTRHEPLSDKLSIHIFELPKFNDTFEEVDYEKLWLKFLKMNSLEAVEMMKNTGTPEIQKAIDELELLNGDEDFREMARMREKAQLDENSRIRGAELRAKFEIAKNFLKLGLSIPQIAAGTGLSEKEIQGLV
jgi:predicted transposase/invertase (TIGR01784 family)